MKLDHRLLRLARAHQAGFLFSITLGLLGGGLVVWQAWLLSAVIGRVFLGGDTPRQVSLALFGLLGVICLRTAAIWGAEALAELKTVDLKEDLRRRLVDHLLALGPGFARSPEQSAGRHSSAEEVHTALEGVEALHAYFSHYLPQIALSALVPLTLLVFILPLDLLSALVLLLTAPLIPLFMVLIGSAAETLTRRQWSLLSRLSGYFHDVLSGLATLKSLGRSQDQAKVVAEASERYRQVTMQVLRVTFLSAFALELVATISTAVVAVEIGLRLLYGQLSFEQALFVLFLAPEFYLPLRALGTRFHAGLAGVAAAGRIFEVLEMSRPQVFTGQADRSRESEQYPAPGEIRFDEVTFTYPEGRQAVRGVSFSLQSGKMLALVGLSGSGKSTLASMLLGFLTPQDGRILVDGRPLNDLLAKDWYSKVAWVPQTPYLFHDTVSANIRLARPTANEAEVQAAARLAQADEFIARMPQGYATVVGERGARLSAGQAQRIALARAYLKDAPVLVLDEPTSFLDPQNESAIRQALEGLMAGRITLIIAHRLSTTRRADQILVLDNGRVRERGTHAELAQGGELYPGLLAAYRGEARQVEGRSLADPVTITTPLDPQVVGRGSPEISRSPELPAGDGPLRWRGSFLRLAGLLAPFKEWMALAALFGFLTVGSGVGLIATSAYIISAAALQPSIAVLQLPIVGVRFFGLARALSRYLERYTSHQVTLRVLTRLRVWFYRALEPLAPARLQAYRSGDLLSRITADITVLEEFFVRALAPPLVAVLTGGVMLAFLVSFHWELALAALAGYLLAGLGLPLWMRRAGLNPGLRLTEKRAAWHADLVDGLLGLADLVLAGQVESYRMRLFRHTRRLAGAQREMAYLTAWQVAGQVGIANLAMWAVLGLAIPLVSGGHLAGVHLAVIALGVLTSFEAFTPLPQAAQYLAQHLASAERLFAVVDVPAAVDRPATPVCLPEHHDLRLREVCFSYPAPWGEAGEQVLAPSLQNISFDLPHGKRLAIVGPSGAGKSSLVNLLLRFWEYQAGEINLSGRSLRDYDPEQLRSHWGVVSQHAHLFNASLGDNLRLANPRASREMLESAARLAEIHDFIQGLPGGYDTWTGELGDRLSAGERQRLVIARALLKNPPLLILDEATANLDPLTERRIMRRILHGKWQAGSRGSLLWISHRLVEMDQMDEILVLEAGRVVERGTHQQLLVTPGLYRQLWDLQNQVVLE